MALVFKTRWKIVSNGLRTQIFDADGNELQYVRVIAWQQTEGELATATVELLGVALEAEIPVRE